LLNDPGVFILLGAMKIAAIVYENMVSSIYRSLVPMQELAHRGHSVHIEERTDPANPELLFEADVVQFCRVCHYPVQHLARRLRRAGVATIWDNDDDVTTIPKDHATHTSLRGRRGKRIHLDMVGMMRCVDVVTTPTELLAARYRRASRADVRVLGNYLPPTFERPERVMPHTGAVRLAWVAAPEHRDDYERLGLADVFQRLLERHLELEIVVFGLDLALNSRRYFQIPFTAYGDLPNTLSRVDFGIAPIADNEFNAIRSDVKLKEYAAMGLPWLASPIGPYAELGEAEGGRLVPDHLWYEEIDALVQDADERSRLGYRARQWAAEERIEAHAEAWEQLYAEAAERAGAAAARATR
jgi:glycosyltransferase involved in cell wall biosynthesis